MKYTEYNEDAGRNEFGAHLESESRKYSALQSLLAGKLLEKDEIESLREFKFVQQFLDSPIGDASEASPFSLQSSPAPDSPKDMPSLSRNDSAYAHRKIAVPLTSRKESYPE